MIIPLKVQLCLRKQIKGKTPQEMQVISNHELPEAPHNW